MRSKLTILAIVAAVCLWVWPVSAEVIYTETFSGSTLPTTLTYSTHPEITWSVSGGQLLADHTGTSSVVATALTSVGYIAPDGYSSVYSLDVGVPSGAPYGNYNVGLMFGGYQAIFHPGLGSGIFRVESGFTSGNQGMGFTPRAGVLHHVEVEVVNFGSAVKADITVTGLDANLADSTLHTFTYSFFDTSPNLGTGTFGARRSGPTSGGNPLSDGFFDNLQFEIQPVPEPSATVLLGSGLLGVLFFWRRSRTCRA